MGEWRKNKGREEHKSSVIDVKEIGSMDNKQSVCVAGMETPWKEN